jgi:adenylate kinase family enzyme
MTEEGAKVIEEVRRAYKECGFVVPDVIEPPEVLIKLTDEAIDERKAELQGYIFEIAQSAIMALLWAERRNWDKVESLLRRIVHTYESNKYILDYLKRATEFKQRLLAILEKGLNSPVQKSR